jgi:hypothetical protein
MPNNITNNVSCYGIKADIKDMWKKISSLDGTKSEFVDFNKIIKKPEGLDDIIEVGNLKKTYKLLLQERKSGIHDDTLDEYINTIHTDKKKITLRENAELYEKCGCQGWYSWSVENWGTKWGSYECRGPKWKKDIFCFSFETAWSPPTPIFHKLAKMFPNITIVNAWMDEGGPSGYMLFRAGKILAEKGFNCISDTELMSMYLEIKEILKGQDIYVYDILKPIKALMEIGE